MNQMNETNRNLLKNGIVFALLGYLLYQFVMEYLAGQSEGFTPLVFVIGLVILGGGTLFTGFLTLKAWKVSQAEAAAAIDAMEQARLESQEKE